MRLLNIGFFYYIYSMNEINIQDPVVGDLVQLINNRSLEGIEKYNTTLEDSPQSPLEFIQHALEEMIDGSLYLMKLKNIINNGSIDFNGYIIQDETEKELELGAEFDTVWLACKWSINIKELITYSSLCELFPLELGGETPVYRLATDRGVYYLEHNEKNKRILEQILKLCQI